MDKVNYIWLSVKAQNYVVSNTKKQQAAVFSYNGSGGAMTSCPLSQMSEDHMSR